MRQEAIEMVTYTELNFLTFQDYDVFYENSVSGKSKWILCIEFLSTYCIVPTYPRKVLM